MLPETVCSAGALMFCGVPEPDGVGVLVDLGRHVGDDPARGSRCRRSARPAPSRRRRGRAFRMPRPSKMPSPIEVAPAGSRPLPLMMSLVALRLRSERPPAPSARTGCSGCASSLKRTRPTPSPSSITSTKMFAACCSDSCLLWPSPRSSLMLPERSSTSAVAVVLRATVLPMTVTARSGSRPASRTVRACCGIDDGAAPVR